ncbi:MAG TPA: hypothetical protein VE326_02285 [Candidatus Binatia bacterium]|nr:hypothetical protein [Candidatus Binatia bacterium]
MRSIPVAALMLALAASLFGGCSERASRLTGNERLLRGDEGLGTTNQSDTLVDRDTYVAPRTTAVRGPTLLVGIQGTYESRALFRPSTWTLPDTLVTTVIDTVRFRVEFDPRVDRYLAGNRVLALHTAAAWDTTNVEWPGPAPGTLLGTGPDGQAPFTIELGASAITQVRAWAADATFPGFVLSIDSGTGVRGFLAGTGRIEIVYHTTLAPTTRVTKVTRLPTDLSIQTPAAPATGSESTLLLGGLFQSEVLLRAPVAPPPAGFSINGARFVAHLLGPASPDTVEIRAYRIRNAWTEGASIDSTLGLDATPLETLTGVRVVAGDSIAIPIPISLAREWSADSTSNQGILIRVTNSFYASEIEVGSRESVTPPVLRVNTTSPPPGRF